jgi:hypothetical protein
LSSFGWCKGENSSVLYILGGSDGYTLQGQLWKINLANDKPGSATDLGAEYAEPTCLSKLGFNQNKI